MYSFKLNTCAFLIFVCISACNSPKEEQKSIDSDDNLIDINKTSLVVLGTAQDAGSPQIACSKKCCNSLYENGERRQVVSIGLTDPKNDKNFLIEASPDIAIQLKTLNGLFLNEEKELVDGIFLTHAHIGHYSGLMYLGKEAMNADQINVFAMPRMRSFLQSNGPWSQLYSNKNILINELREDSTIVLSSNLSITPFLVPHRDEYSETVGYTITGPNKSALFIPDIDKWEKWDSDIIVEISKVDYAFLDATFYDGEEINNRDISEIPHPFILESMELFKELSMSEKNKIHFIHFNHTNPVLNEESEQSLRVEENGYHIARQNDIIEL